jgi:hypothetical protein
MPVKLPDPVDGTDAQPDPNGAAMVDALGEAEAGMDDADAVGLAEAPDAELLDPLEPHAATPNATLAPTAAMAATLYFTGTPPWLFFVFPVILERSFGGRLDLDWSVGSGRGLR